MGERTSHRYKTWKPTRVRTSRAKMKTSLASAPAGFSIHALASTTTNIEQPELRRHHFSAFVCKRCPLIKLFSPSTKHSTPLYTRLPAAASQRTTLNPPTSVRRQPRSCTSPCISSRFLCGSVHCGLCRLACNQRVSHAQLPFFTTNAHNRLFSSVRRYLATQRMAQRSTYTTPKSLSSFQTATHYS